VSSGQTEARDCGLSGAFLVIYYGRPAADGMVAGGEPPSKFTAFVNAELAEWAKLIREMKL
jgi:hypothetical protein